MKRIRNSRRKKRLCKGMALLLIAALLLNQSSLLMYAEEGGEEVWEDAVTEEETENPDAGEGVDTGTDTESVPDMITDEEIGDSGAGEETEEPDVDTGENTDADEEVNSDTASDVDGEDEGESMTPTETDEAEDTSEENAVSPAEGDGTFTDGAFTYTIISEDEVELTQVDSNSVSGDLHISSPISIGGKKYTVVRIGNHALAFCNSLISITIPSGVTSIGISAFEDCSSLESITIPSSVTSIEDTTFSRCRKLENVIIPSGVTSIGVSAFGECSSLESITIPNSVTSIGEAAFTRCGSLKSVTILNDNVSLGISVFFLCRNVDCLRIALSEKITETPTVVSYGNVLDSFAGCSVDRYLTFLTEDGTTELSDTTTPTLAAAVKAYDEADGKNDGMWYGWKLEKAPEIPDPDYYPVTIQVNKDDSEWNDSGKTFALLPDNNGTFITELNKVPEGTYTIYDATDAEDSDSYVNTNVIVEVKDGDASAEINYYTITFHDGDALLHDYDQIVLKDAKVGVPSPTPTKAGYNFKQWATAADGSIAFNFDDQIKAKTDIYASWTLRDVDVKLYTITASAGDGGSIEPSGQVDVESGENQRFVITPKDGYRISSVLVDDHEELNNVQTADYLRAGISDGENNVKYYDFENVTSNHTLAASFETVQTDDGDVSAPVVGGGGSDDSGSDSTGGSDGGHSGSGGGGTDNSISVISSNMSAAPDAVIVTTDATVPDSRDKEPKTGDTFHMEVYATLAMIAGLFYLLLYFADGVGGMTEEEKSELIAKLVKWAKKGKPVRKYATLAAVFMVLVYYHSIGKRTVADWQEVYES